MKILHISDTHGHHNQLPHRFDSIDIVIHSGDCSNHRVPIFNEKEVINFLNWYSSIPIEHKVYVAGNHDTAIEKRLVTPTDFQQNNIIYLENSGITIKGIKFWGSPYTPVFADWAFMHSDETLKATWDQIPEDTEVLITHGPPKGILDQTYSQKELKSCGCEALLKRCISLKETLRLVAFGHIHNNTGITQHSFGKTIFSNAACVRDDNFDLGLYYFGNIISL